MINKTKKRIALLLSSTACLLLAFGATGIQAEATEAEEPAKVFAMSRTAGVRFAKTATDKTGIRFATRLNKAAFDAYVGGGAELTVTFEVDKAGNTDEGEAQNETYTITKNQFADKDEITLYYSILFNLNEDEILPASQMLLEAKCYLQPSVGEPVYAENCSETQGVVQDMRSVASFNALQPSVTGDLTAYFGTQSEVDGTASYRSGTLGVKIDLGEEIGSDKTVYINTHKVDNAVIDGTTVTIAKEDMPEMLGEPINPTNYIQIFDENNNVTVKELTETPVAKSVENFSAADGDFNTAEILGESVTVNAVETVSNSAVAEGEEFADLTFADNKLSGLETASDDWTNAVVRLTTDYTVYDVNVKAATKIIDEAEDLKVFTVKAAEVAEGEDAHATEVSGFYALTQDIDASELVLDAHSGYKATWYPTPTVDKGFTGTLDGQGHTVSNLTVKGEGLFSVVYGGTIKNIGFVNGKAEAGSGYTAFFAQKMILAELSNVYVHVTSLNGNKTAHSVITNSTMHKVKMTNVVVDYAQTAFDEGEYYASLGLIDGKTTTTNQGVWSNVYAISSTPLALDSGYIMVASNQSETEVTALKDKFLAGQTVTALTVDGVKSYASAAVMATDTNDLTAFESKYWTVKAGVPYWNGVSESDRISSDDFAVKATSDGEGYGFKNQISFAFTDTLGNALSVQPTVSLINSTDSDCVIASGNTLSKNTEYTVSEDREIAIRLTATVNGFTVEKDITVTLLQNFDDYNQVSISNLYIEADGTLVGLSQDNQTALENVTYKTGLKGTAIAFADGKFNMDFLAEATLGDSSSIVAISEDTVYTLNYRYVTKAIDDASDLTVFQAVSKGVGDNNKSTGTYAIDGYYVLTKNINASGLTLAHGKFYNDAAYPNGSYDGGFKGTLDGQGYTIFDLTTPSTGLFSQIFGGTVKNIGFVNASLGGYYKTLFGQRVYDATIENVYIQMSTLPNGGYVLAVQELLRSTLTNVVIDVEAATITSGGIFGIANFSGRQYFANKGTWTNVYVLSELPFEAGYKELYVNNAWGWYDYLVVAENTTEEQITEYWKLGVYSDTVDNYDTVVLDDVRSYANAAAMQGKEDVSGFTTYWDITSGAPVWNNSVME